MRLYIPSSGRAHEQHTISHLPHQLLEHVVLVVPENEYEDYNDHWGMHVYIEGIEAVGIGPTRQWCCDQQEKKCLMLDDDLRFATRRKDDPTKFHDATDDEVITALRELWGALDHHSHVGMATREGGNRYTEDWDYDTRLLRILGYRTDIMRDLDIRFDQIPVMEDFYVSLSLLSRGLGNAKLNWMVQDQKGSQSTGGCSQYRTMDVQAQAAHHLKEHFPDFVKVVEKTTKTAWGGGTRTDVQIQWKKAKKYGQQRAI